MENVSKILTQYPHTTPNMMPQCIERILNEMAGVLEAGIEGDIVELGCHAGLTSVYLQRLLDSYQSPKALHLYDSFDGLPEKMPQDMASEPNEFVQGYFKLPQEWLIERFKQNNLQTPVIHAGWFRDQVYPEPIAFGFLDGDFYSSIMDSLNAVWPKLSKGGVICIHDYKWDKLCGVEQACKDFFGNLDNIKDTGLGLGVIQK